MSVTMDKKSSTMSIGLRSRVLNQIADCFAVFEREDLDEIFSLENGKISAEAAFEVDMIPSKLWYWAAVVLTDYGRALKVLPGHLAVVTRWQSLSE